ncbi:MAG: tRNA(Ile)-lysidine synthetase, partial [Opitutaceae bacterium]|nr:tRNA(Ile)-lysidine synthetase [Opitutaceae bacterium]
KNENQPLVPLLAEVGFAELLAQKRPADLSRQGFEALLAAVERGQPTRFSLGTKSFAVIREGKLSSQYS